MKYLCLIYLEETKIDALSASELDALMGDGTAWMEELEQSGHHVMSAGLQSTRMATTLRKRRGKVIVTDGPFAETKEQLGGFTIIDARDLNEAIRLASKLAAVGPGSIEVRPIDDLIASSHVGTQREDTTVNHPHAGQATDIEDATPTSQRKVIALMHISLDGFCAGPNGELEWAAVGEEMYKDVAGLVSTVDTALYGRVTYQMMESYWPTVPGNPSSTEDELHHAHWVENVEKIVFSRTLDAVTWNNTRLVKENIAAEIARLKQQPGKNMMIFGSPSIVHTLTQHGLIDEYRITVNPIVLGSGIPLFKGVKEQIDLKLLAAKTFRSGVVGLHYRTASGDRTR